MKIKILFTILLLSSIKLMAQSDTSIYYFDEKMMLQPNSDNAFFTREVIKDADDDLFTVRDFYRNNNIMRIVKSRNNDGLDPVGTVIDYFPNGKRKKITQFEKNGLYSFFSYYQNGALYESAKYVKDKGLYISEIRDSTGKVMVENGNGTGLEIDDILLIRDVGPIKDGKKNGEWTRYIKGFLKCVLNYNDGRFLSGIGYDEDGNQYPFDRITEYANYKDDDIGRLDQEIKNKLIIPKQAKKDKIDRVVQLSFIIQKEGSVTDVLLEKAAGYGIDEQIVSAIKNTDHMWIPRKEYGIPVKEVHEFSIRIAPN